MQTVDSRAHRSDSLVAGGAAVAAAILFTAFVIAKGVPALRHDWNWPIDRIAIPSFVGQAFSGWLPIGFGMANPHPTTYLVALPLAATMWVLGPLAGLALLAFAAGLAASAGASGVARRWRNPLPASIGIALFAIFNPWVYNQVVAGHLIMILAYGGVLALLAEMARGPQASPVRMALLLAVVEAQLQFFLVAGVALAAFALVTKKWLPLAAGAVVALPTIVGIVAERGALLQTPYSVAWQANQSLSPVALLSLGGYFPGYADRLGAAAQIAVWTICAMAIAGAVVARRRRAVRWATLAAACIYVIALGVHGPFDAAYEWVVRSVPESGVFRELYDFGGVFAALLALLASAAVARAKALSYVALIAGAALALTWALHPPSAFWISARALPKVPVAASAFSRVAFLPAFQPLQLRDGGGDGADPDAFVYPDHVAPLNVYLPRYPVDMALARYAQYADASALQALGVSQILDRPWLLSRSNGGIGLAASSLAGSTRARPAESRRLVDPAPLISQCDGVRIVASVGGLGLCDLFFGDAPGFGRVVPVAAPSDSIDPQTAWIDATLAFARAPFLAQGLGGALTQSTLPHKVHPGSWLLAYVRGRLGATDGNTLTVSPGAFAWLFIPPNVTAVVCRGLCELVAESRTFPALPLQQPAGQSQPVAFSQFTPWLYRVQRTAEGARMLRLNERYDGGWTAISGWHVLPHVRLNLAANGWFLNATSASDILLVQVTALAQLIAELLGLTCVALLLKALVREPTKRA